MRKPLREMQTTDDSAYYKKARKAYLASSSRKGIRCSFCSYHAKENRESLPQRSWKKFRRFQRKELRYATQDQKRYYYDSGCRYSSETYGLSLKQIAQINGHQGRASVDCSRGFPSRSFNRGFILLKNLQMGASYKGITLLLHSNYQGSSPYVSTTCNYGGTGRRASLRNQWSNP